MWGRLFSTEEEMRNIRKYDKYDLWFSEVSSGRLDDLLPLYKKAGGRGVFESGVIKAGRDNLDFYEKGEEWLEKEDIKIVCLEDDDYPPLLKEIYDPPYLLFYRGRLPDPDGVSCAVVGARKSSPYGRKAAYEIGKALGAAGAEVISGMALGADSFAHRGCMDGRGRTFAVLGTGLESTAKVTDRDLYNRILQSGGGIISELPPGTPGLPQNYPRRNRIISGLSKAVVVTEAAKRSGTSITARLALEQGRDVYAVPGNIDSALSLGTNSLIREGATPIISYDSIVEEVGLEKKISPARRTCLAGLGDDEKVIYNVVKNLGRISPDRLCSEVGKSQTELSPILSVMEIKGIIRRELGKITIAN